MIRINTHLDPIGHSLDLFEVDGCDTLVVEDSEWEEFQSAARRFHEAEERLLDSGKRDVPFSPAELEARQRCAERFTALFQEDGICMLCGVKPQ